MRYEKITHMAIAAHQDDIEFMAYSGIAECFGQKDKGFSACVVTDGGGSPRAGKYADYTDAQMIETRCKEQKRAAEIGKYKSLSMLMYPSKAVKDKNNPAVVSDILKLLTEQKPKIVYTHNFADKHDTHVAVAARVISAIRQMPLKDRPEKLYGCEVWRGLDWMCGGGKISLDCSRSPELALEIMEVFDSQIAGGKNYARAVIGRRTSNATFAESHGVDECTQVSYAMDMTPLILNEKLNPLAFTVEKIKEFETDVKNRVKNVI